MSGLLDPNKFHSYFAAVAESLLQESLADGSLQSTASQRRQLEEQASQREAAAWRAQKEQLQRDAQTPSSSRGESLRETLTVIAAELSGESDGVHFESVGPGVTVRAVAHFER